MAVIEYARNQRGLIEANSTEIDSTCEAPVIDLMDSQKNISKKGGTMRLGAWDCNLLTNTKASESYGKKTVSERHRHRYEFNDDFTDKVFDENFIVSGINPDTGLVEIIEYKNHPWFIGVQFHPEFKSRPLSPHPLFSSFIKAAKNHK